MSETNNLSASTLDEISRMEVDDATMARILHRDEASVRRYARTQVIHREKSKKFALFNTIGAVVEHLRAVAGGRRPAMP